MVIAPMPGSSTLPSFGTAVSSRNTPPSIRGRYTKNNQNRVEALNLNRRNVPQRLAETLR